MQQVTPDDTLLDEELDTELAERPFEEHSELRDAADPLSSLEPALRASEKALEAVLVKHLLAALGSSGAIAAKRLRGYRAAGGPGSGNFGHSGRPGEVGGSSSEPPRMGFTVRPGKHVDLTQLRNRRFLFHPSGTLVIGRERDVNYTPEEREALLSGEVMAEQESTHAEALDNILKRGDYPETPEAYDSYPLRGLFKGGQVHVATWAGSENFDDHLANLVERLLIHGIDPGVRVVGSRLGRRHIDTTIQKGWPDLVRRYKHRAAGGKGSGNFGHSGRPGQIGGSAVEPVPLDQDAYNDPRYEDLIGGLRAPNEYDVKRVKADLKKRGQLNADGTASFYHVTLDGETVDSIMKHGLIPAFQAAPGQDWQAEHSKYANYFHQDREVAERDAEQSGGVIIEARIPITENTLIRFVPDEDWSPDIQDGIKTIQEGGAVAFIGGVPKEALRVHRMKALGGPGSGNFGHAGRPGEVGGSLGSLNNVEKDWLRGWTEGNNWKDTQHAARAVLDGLSRDEYVCYDCKGDDGKRYDKAKRLLDVIDQSPVGKPLYRGLQNVDLSKFEVGKTFTESLSSWTGKQDLAHDFAEGHFKSGFFTPDAPTGKVLLTLVGEDMHGVNVSEHSDKEPYKSADEWLTSGTYEVVSSRTDAGGVTLVDVRRIGNAGHKSDFRAIGGVGSGNFGHAGRPGYVGGSAPVLGADAELIKSHERYDITKTGDRRFLFNPKTGTMVFGAVDTRKAQEWAHSIALEAALEKNPNVADTDQDYDDYTLRGLIFEGGGKYGVNRPMEIAIYTAPRNHAELFDAMDQLLEHAVKNGAPAETSVTGQSGMDRATTIGKGWQYLVKKMKAAGLHEMAARLTAAMRVLGGPGSGNFGHSGRPGEVGGSGPGGEAVGVKEGTATPGWQTKWYSFPENGAYTATHLASFPAKDADVGFEKVGSREHSQKIQDVAREHGAVAPEGHELVYRLGSPENTSLANKNAANADGLANFIERTEENLTATGDTIHVFAVKFEKPLGKYELYRRGGKESARGGR